MVRGQRCQVYDRVAFQNRITFLKREAKREEGRCGKERESGEEPARYLRPSWGGEKRPPLVLFLSSAERRAAAAGSYCAHCEARAVRNVWPALWETPLQGPQLSQPGDLNSATESSMVKSWQGQIRSSLQNGEPGPTCV